MANNNDSTNGGKQEVETKQVSTSSTNNSRNLLFGLLGLAVLIVVFLAGMSVQRHERHPGAATFKPIGVGPGFGGRRFGGQFFNKQNGTSLSGKITTVNGSDFTLDQNGSSKTIKTDSNTRFAGVGIDGLKSGDQVGVVGTANSDGSVQALRVIVTSSSSSNST